MVWLCTPLVLSATLLSASRNKVVHHAPETALQVNREMGLGFNLGNTFDLGLQSQTLTDAKPVIDLYVSAGMKHVRIPITWGSPVKGEVMADAMGKINTSLPRFVQLKAVVDYALSKNIYVIINTHHEHWLKDHYDGTETFDRPFRNLWTGIATEFRGRSQKLIFETLNEPAKKFGDWSGPVKPKDPQALAFTRRVNEVAWKAIRQTGGANATRIVMVGTNGMGNHSMLSSVYPESSSLPGGGSDRYLIATVHTYDPWNFCGENGSNEKWPGEAAIANPIKAVAAHGRKLGVPINYGEFGVGRDKKPEERNSDAVRGYYRAVWKVAKAEGMSATVWDDRGWFGLIARAGDGWRFTNEIVPSMMK